MNPLIAAAQFAALVRFNRTQPPNAAEAARYARGHWPDFLPSVNEGLGRLLLAMSARRPRARGAFASPDRLPGRLRQRVARAGQAGQAGLQN